MYKKWISYFLIYGIIFCISFVGFNFVINPYGIFAHKNKFSKVKNHIASDRMTKLYYTKRLQPKTILIGTSRVGVINPKTVEKYTHNKAYNLSLDASSIKEQYQYIKFIINTTSVNNLIWGIDFFSFNPDSKLPFSFSQQRLEKDFYLQDYRDALLTMDVLFASIATLKDNIRNKKSKLNLDNGQNYFLEHKVNYKIQGEPFLDRKIEEGLKGYKKTKELYGSEKFKNYNTIDENFILIQEIVNLCHKKDINLHVYISPIYIKTLQLIRELDLWKTYRYFKINLAKATPFWGFNENFNITSNKENFWDNSHVREEVGGLMMNSIFNKNNNYGKLITSDNVLQHLNNLEKTIK